MEFSTRIEEEAEKRQGVGGWEERRAYLERYTREGRRRCGPAKSAGHARVHTCPCHTDTDADTVRDARDQKHMSIAVSKSICPKAYGFV